jgi:tetratricopeptide (TPR) repeat protein
MLDRKYVGSQNRNELRICDDSYSESKRYAEMCNGSDRKWVFFQYYIDAAYRSYYKAKGKEWFLTHLKEAMNLFDEDSEEANSYVLYHFILYYLANGEYGLAEKYIKKTLGLSYGKLQGYYKTKTLIAKAYCVFMQGKSLEEKQQAILDLQDAVYEISLSGKKHIIYFLRARLLEDGKQKEEAISCYKQCIDLLNLVDDFSYYYKRNEAYLYEIALSLKKLGFSDWHSNRLTPLKDVIKDVDKNGDKNKPKSLFESLGVSYPHF